ncbi:hypothetical protein Tco_1503632 [Tanacetum coccineum]
MDAPLSPDHVFDFFAAEPVPGLAEAPGVGELYRKVPKLRLKFYGSFGLQVHLGFHLLMMVLGASGEILVDCVSEPVDAPLSLDHVFDFFAAEPVPGLAEAPGVGLKAEMLGEGEKLTGLQFIQLELRLGKIPSRSFRPVKSAKILWQFGGTDISQKDEKPSKKRQNRTRDGKVCEDEAQSKSRADYANLGNFIYKRKKGEKGNEKKKDVEGLFLGLDTWLRSAGREDDACKQEEKGPTFDVEPLEQIESNVILDSTDMCDNEGKDDQNIEQCDDERVVLANLIANLKLDTDENKRIQNTVGTKVNAAELQLLERLQLAKRIKMSLDRDKELVGEQENYGKIKDMEFESTNSNTTAKLPILKLGDRDVVIGLEAYLTNLRTYARSVGHNRMHGFEVSILAKYEGAKSTNREDKQERFVINANDTAGSPRIKEVYDWSDKQRTSSDEYGSNAFSDSEVYTDKTCLKNYETLEKQCNDLIVKLNQTKFTAATYKRGLATVEEQLITYRKNEVLFSEEVAVRKREVACKDYEINMLKSEFEKVKHKKEGIEFKIEKFDKASKYLDQLLGSQITDKSKKGLGYSAVPPPYPLIYNRPKKLDLSYSGLNEFKEPEFKGYGSSDITKESNVVCDKKSGESKENSDNPLVKEQVSKDTSSFVESSLNVDKETVFPVDKKVESVKPKDHEKPVKKSVRLRQATTRYTDLLTVDSQGHDWETIIAYLLVYKNVMVVHVNILEGGALEVEFLIRSMLWQEAFTINFKKHKYAVKDNLVHKENLMQDVDNGEPKSAADDQKQEIGDC